MNSAFSYFTNFSSIIFPFIGSSVTRVLSYNVYLDVETLYAWYESTHVTLDPINGKIIDEKFVK